jgi:hypothetical protein
MLILTSSPLQMTIYPMRCSPPKFLSAIFLISLGSCLATVKQTYSRITHLHSTEAPKKEEPLSPGPTPSQTSALSGTGDAVIRALGDRKFVIFVHRSPTESCAAGIDEKVLFYDENTAIRVFSHCQEIAPNTLQQRLFQVSPVDSSVMILDRKLLDREDNKNDSGSLWCEGGQDSAGRGVAVLIKRSFSSGELTARLILTGMGQPENQVFSVKPVTEKGFTVYSTGQPAALPYFNLKVANINGLTGFLAYNFKGTGSGTIGQSRKEEKVTFPNCIAP